MAKDSTTDMAETAVAADPVVIPTDPMKAFVEYVANVEWGSDREDAITALLRDLQTKARELLA